METFWRKVWSFGFGMWDFTREKFEALVQEMVRRGEIKQQESPELVEKIMATARESQQAVADKVKEIVQKTLSEMGLARSADLEALEKRVSALEEKIPRP